MRSIAAIAIALAFVQHGGSPVGDLPAKYKTTPPAGSKVVARVNGVEITAGDVEPLLWEWRGVDAIQDLINYQIIRAEAQKDRVNVADADVEKAIDDFLPEFQKQVPQGVSVEAALASEGLTRSRLFLRFKTQLLMQKIVEREFAPDKMAEVSTIVFRFANEQTAALTDAIKRADDAYARLRKGESWDSILATTTEDPNVLKSKGLLGWRDMSVFPAPVREEFKTLSPGGITKPVQTPNGIQIFRLEMLGKDAKGQNLEGLRKVYFDNAKAQLLNRLRAETKIDRLYPPNTSR